MVRDYVDEAKKLEKLAFGKRKDARYVKTSVRDAFLRDAIKGYEEAAKCWMREAKQNQKYPRKAKYALLNAKNDLNLSKSIKAELHEKDLSRRLFSAITAIFILASALFFVSFSLTGDVVLGVTENNSRWTGLFLFICGLILAFFYFKKK